MKTALLCTALLVVMMIGFVQPAVAQGTGGQSSTSGTHPLVPAVPMPDDELGCYIYTNSTGWLSQPCQPTVQTVGPISDQTASQTGGYPTLNFGGSYGEPAVYANGVPIIQSNVLIQFNLFTGEKDTGTSGSNDWSIQDNTNVFLGTNSQIDWVQFAVQNQHSWLFGLGKAQAVISEEDVTTSTYTTYPTGISVQSLSSTTSDIVEGWVSQSGSSYYLDEQFCNNSTCWGVTAPDLYGLYVGGTWQYSSGDILGFGSGSTAQFTSPTTEHTWVEPRASTTLNGQSTSYVETAEMNNLNMGSTSFSCASNVCDYIVIEYN